MQAAEGRLARRPWGRGRVQDTDVSGGRQQLAAKGQEARVTRAAVSAWPLSQGESRSGAEWKAGRRVLSS